MARRRKQKLPKEAIACEILGFSHEGRGIAKLEGKTQFVEGALPGEKILATYIERRSKFDELNVQEVLEASPERISPPCAHFEVCGGCSLQHLGNEAQIRFKQSVLKEQFGHFGGIEPEEWQAPMLGPTQGYRGKARLGVRYVAKRDQVLVGFREKRNRFITDIAQCMVLDARIGHRLEGLRDLVRSLSVYQSLPQIEVAIGDHGLALVMRHMNPLTENDTEKLIAFAEAHEFDLYLQPKGPDSVHKIWPVGGEDRLYYSLPVLDNQQGKDVVELAFHPLDFTQVNSEINRKMVLKALNWLDVKDNERVLDLFCGLGNFTIPLAMQAKKVVGVEGAESMVHRGTENAKRNGLNNTEFYAADLQSDFTKESWASQGFDKILIDPPRSGALDVVSYLPAFGASRIVYVSCNPATLARDTGILIEQGYKLKKAGVMDMFPHTSHVESIALFEKE